MLVGSVVNISSDIETKCCCGIFDRSVTPLWEEPRLTLKVNFLEEPRLHGIESVIAFDMDCACARHRIQFEYGRSPTT